MKPVTFFCILLLFANPTVFAQMLTQYFDGYDEPNYSITIQIDSTKRNSWQIGKPQKKYFNAAASNPNVLVTDTLNAYPINDTSRFTISLDLTKWRAGIDAIEWKQKLDVDSGKDGAIIEYSTDSGVTWQNVFYNPFVYNFYGFDSATIDTLPGGEFAFSGRDTTWRDIWLCFDKSWVTSKASVFLVRFTLLTDSIQQNKEGWMIDNMVVHPTFLHAAVNKIQGNDLFKIYPNPANTLLHIESAQLSGQQIIEKMELFDTQGKLVIAWSVIPAKFFIDVRNYESGMYYLKISTKDVLKTYPIVISHD